MCLSRKTWTSIICVVSGQVQISTPPPWTTNITEVAGEKTKYFTMWTQCSKSKRPTDSIWAMILEFEVTREFAHGVFTGNCETLFGRLAQLFNSKINWTYFNYVQKDYWQCGICLLLNMWKSLSLPVMQYENKCWSIPHKIMASEDFDPYIFLWKKKKKQYEKTAIQF